MLETDKLKYMGLPRPALLLRHWRHAWRSVARGADCQTSLARDSCGQRQADSWASLPTIHLPTCSL